MLRKTLRIFAIASIAVAPCAARADGQEAVLRREFRLESAELRVSNLIGEIRIGRAAGTAFEVTAEVFGEDAREEPLDFEVSEGGQGTLNVVYPEGATRFRYPPMGRGSNVSFSRQDAPGSWVRWLVPGAGGDQIRVSGSGRGTEVWADLTILVPDGRSLTLAHGVGDIAANDLRAVLSLSSRAGEVAVGSIEGDITVDTGSGSVTASLIDGKLSIDTGSGSVDLERCSGPSIRVDTGSGSVHASGVDTKNLSVDTGSGGIRATGLSADTAVLDTGSGSIEVSFDRLGPGPMRIDTGAGSIDVGIPRGSSIELRAETGSGDIRLAGIDGIEILERDRDMLHARSGSQRTMISLDTGSGGIEISGR